MIKSLSTYGLHSHQFVEIGYPALVNFRHLTFSQGETLRERVVRVFVVQKDF